MSDVSVKVTEALSNCGFLTTLSLAKGLGVGKDKIVDAFDEIEAAGIKMMRVCGPGGGASFIGKRMRTV